MNKQFRKLIGNLLVLTFMFSCVGVGYVQAKNAPALEESPTQMQLQVKVGFYEATHEEIDVKSSNGWQSIGYYYGDDTFKNDAQDIMVLAMGLASSAVGLGLTPNLVTTAAGIYRRHYNNANKITAYYKREMCRSTDNPIYWRDTVTYYFDANHTLQVDDPVIGNVYEMMDRNNK